MSEGRIFKRKAVTNDTQSVTTRCAARDSASFHSAEVCFANKSCFMSLLLLRAKDGRRFESLAGFCFSKIKKNAASNIYPAAVWRAARDSASFHSAEVCFANKSCFMSLLLLRAKDGRRFESLAGFCFSKIKKNAASNIYPAAVWRAARDSNP